MAICPNCTKPIEITDKHLGALFNCPHCNAVFFVGWDGQPETHSHEPVADTPSEHLPPSAPTEAFVENLVPENSVSQDFIVESGIAVEAPAMHEPEPGAYAPSAETPSYEAVSHDEAAPESAASEPEAPYIPQADNSESFSDVTDYGNSNQPAGPLSYTIILKGLELAETFELLREAMNDSRFGWEIDDVMSKVRGGELTLRGLNPTKASILINRIKSLPIELSWTQEVYGE